MAFFDYCGSKVIVLPVPSSRHCFYVSCGPRLGHKDLIQSESLASRYPRLTQEDLFHIICIVKHKYNIS